MICQRLPAQRWHWAEVRQGVLGSVGGGGASERRKVEAAATRLRPILMTTAATVFGHLPLVFARGPGAGARNSIGIALVTGMIIGTAFTLFVVPAIYTLVAKVHKKEEAIELGEEEVEQLPHHEPEPELTHV